MTRCVNECDLDAREYERDIYRQIAKISRDAGLIDVLAEQRFMPADLLTEPAQELRLLLQCKADKCRQGRDECPCPHKCIAEMHVPEDNSPGFLGALRAWIWGH